MKRIVAYDAVAVPITAIKSNPIPFSVASTKLAIYVDYTKGAEDGIELSLEWSDNTALDWAIVGDFGGATSPGVNAIFPFTGTLTASGTYLIPIPQRLLVQGGYRLSLVRSGSTAPTGTVYAILKNGEY